MSVKMVCVRLVWTNIKGIEEILGSRGGKDYQEGNGDWRESRT